MCVPDYLPKKRRRKEDDFCPSLILLLLFFQIVKASERRRQYLHQSQSDPTMLAAGLTRKGIALGKMENLSKDNEPVTDTFQKTLPVHHNPDTLKKLNDAEKAKRELQQQEYFDIKLANEEHEKGIPF